MSNRQRQAVPSATEPSLSADGIFNDRPADTASTALAPGTLYIVSMPIGDPEDISLRALRILSSVTVIASENPPRTRAVLRRFQITTPVTGYRERAGGNALESLIELLRSGAAAALVTDSGTPMVADAGGTVVRAAIKAGIPRTAVPGPVAALVAFTLSGAVGPFVFEGFPPRIRLHREAFFSAIALESRTVLLYETRRFLPDTLKRLKVSLGANRQILIARDLTKLGETLFEGALDDAEQCFRDPPAGEYTIVLAPH